MSRPRNERNLPDGQVGNRLDRGQLTGGVKGGMVWANAAMLGTGVTVELTPDEAQEFADSLYAWANQALANRRR